MDGLINIFFCSFKEYTLPNTMGKNIERNIFGLASKKINVEFKRICEKIQAFYEQINCMFAQMASHVHF
jgi:hypothetical protein